jgi:hypothetical protein
MIKHTGEGYYLTNMIYFAEETGWVGKWRHWYYFFSEWVKKEEMTPLIVDYVMKNPKVSLQTHKYQILLYSNKWKSKQQLWTAPKSLDKFIISDNVPSRARYCIRLIYSSDLILSRYLYIHLSLLVVWLFMGLVRKDCDMVGSLNERGVCLVTGILFMIKRVFVGS